MPNVLRDIHKLTVHRIFCNPDRAARYGAEHNESGDDRIIGARDTRASRNERDGPEIYNVDA